MIKKCVLVYLTVLFTTALCEYEGDPCKVDGQNGICTIITQCQPVIDEILKAGSHISSSLRIKLRNLQCGFYYNDPLVCCFKSSNVDNNESNANNGTNITNNSNDLNTRRDDENTDDITDESTNGYDASKHKNFDLLPTNCGSVETDKIYGGKTTGLFEMPWMALIAYDSPYGRQTDCAGTLINENYVLTAAHCISFLGTRKPVIVYLGEQDKRTNPDCEPLEDNSLFCAPPVTEAGVGKLIPHPGYNPQTVSDDIGLIRLSQPAAFELDSIKPICLPFTAEMQTEPLVGLEGILSGWGAVETGLQSDVLRKVKLPILANIRCEIAFKTNLTDKQMCAGGYPNRDSCSGDSGGPLMLPGVIRNTNNRLVQRGVVSFGSKRCGIKGIPGVYTRVASYMKWILDNIEE